MKNNWIAKFELTDAVESVKDKEPGEYTLRELIGEVTWSFILRKRWIGRVFKSWVGGNHIPNVRWAYQRSDKRQVYEVVAQ